jgi:hypothetical protein
MTDNGTATYTNPDDYKAAIARENIRLTITAGSAFEARLTWLKLHNLRVLRGHEKFPDYRLHLPAFGAGFCFVSNCRFTLNLGRTRDAGWRHRIPQPR